MPSCADFAVISEYLSIKDQIDSGFYPDQPEVPDILDKQKYEDTFLWPAAVEDEGLKPANFLDMERGPWYLEPVDKTTLFDLTDVTMATTTTTNNNNNTTTAAAAAPTAGCMQNGSAARSQPPVSHSMTYVAAGAGCTVIQRTPTHSYESDSSSPARVDDGSPDIFDLDKQSFYGDDTTSSSDFTAAKVKEEPASYPPHGYVPSGYCPSASDGSHRPAPQGYGAGGYGGSVRPVLYRKDSAEALMINSITAEIRNTSKALGIPKSPYLWDARDSMRWVRHVCHKNSFPDDCAPLFNVHGEDLCKMTVDDFKWRAAEDVALFLHQSLDIIKMSLQIEPDTPIEEQSAFFSGAVEEKAHAHSVDQYNAWPHTASPSPSTGSQSSSSDEDSYASSTYSASQAASHNAAGAVSAPQRGARAGKQTIHLWQFLRELLDDPDTYQSCIKWLDRARGVFKIEDSSKVAKYWGRRKNRPAMNYDKLSRSVRQYYKKGIIKKTEMSKRLVYQFCTPYL